MRVGAGTLAKNARPIALKAIRRGIYPGICLVNFHFDLDFLANRRRDGKPTTIASLTSFRDIATERKTNPETERIDRTVPSRRVSTSETYSFLRRNHARWMARNGFLKSSSLSYLPFPLVFSSLLFSSPFAFSSFVLFFFVIVITRNDDDCAI